MGGAILSERDRNAWKSVAGSVAKWLIPSATVLFAAMGYLIAAAQSSLLGVQLPIDANVYAQNASEFVAEVPRLLSQVVEAFFPHFGDIFLGDWWLWLAGIALLIAGLAIPRRRHAHPDRRKRSDFDRVTPAALALLVILKFMLLDVPLGEIRDVVVSHESTTSAAIGQGALRTAFARPPPTDAGANNSFTLRTQGVQTTFIEEMAPNTDVTSNVATNPNIPARPSNSLNAQPMQGRISGWFAARTQALWDDVLCSRISLDRPEDVGHRADILQCHPERARYLWRLRGAFLIQLAVAAAIAALSVAVLTRAGASHAGVSLAILALLYCLTVANAYGKLIKPTQFDFGVVRLAKPPTVSSAPSANPASASSGPPVPAKSNPKAPAQPDELDGLILNRDSSGTDLLILEQGWCSIQGGPRYAAVRLAWLSNAQVLSVQEIYRQDVITWAAFSEQLCPKLSTYTTSHKH